ncbi:MAG: glutamate racemase [Bacteroidales bacterium]|nr:glutamate racemase [Bacteroidales bacterium]
MKESDNKKSPIGVFDSGYGGLTILDKIQEKLPGYDFIYLGDNARAPYGSRSFEIVYKFTLEAVKKLFDMGCNLVILACNTASAKALRSIQQNDLPLIAPSNRVLGVIRPTAEYVALKSKTRHVGLFGTQGTVQSNSYPLELKKLAPDLRVESLACPMWVPLIENGEAYGQGADYFVKKYVDILLEKDDDIDSIILGCTHYPILKSKIESCLPKSIEVISQGELVAESLADYLNRHPEIDRRISKNGETHFYTTESADKFSDLASLFLNRNVDVEHLDIE